MTSDAKVGLLLGLLFIFLIAFVINGLPNFYNGANSNKLTIEKPNWQSNDIGLKSEAVKSKVIEEVTISPGAEGFCAKDNVVDNSTRGGILPGSEDKVAHKAIDIKAAVNPPVQESSGGGSSAHKPMLSRYYIVKSGDSLAAIAKKFYGEDIGNKRAVVIGLYKANSGYIKSADDIRAGQKLVIPPLDSAGDEGRVRLLDNPIFEKVKSIGRAVSSISGKKCDSVKYVVKSGDCLEKIAAKELGNPRRYVDIVKLNRDVLKDEDNISVGMVLKIPTF